MRRMLLIAAAPAAAAVVVVLTGAYRPGSTPSAQTATTATSAAATIAPAGALVLGGQAGDLAVGLAVRRAGEDGLELQATVLGPDGSPVEGLDLAFDGEDETVRGAACGQARYCAKLGSAPPGRVAVRVKTGHHSGVAAEFGLPARWQPAGDFVDRATRVYRGLRSVVFVERLGSGAGDPVETTWRVEAPDRLAYHIAGGGSAIVIGDRRWDRESDDRPWVESPQDPLRLPQPPWTDAVANASLLGTDAVDGREAWVVSFLDRATRPTWFTLWIDRETFRTLRLTMTTAAHFMRHRYLSFDEGPPIEPPQRTDAVASSGS